MKEIDLSRTEVSNLIDEYIIGNNAIRDREILKDNILDGLSYYELSEKYNLSLTRIREKQRSMIRNWKNQLQNA